MAARTADVQVALVFSMTFLFVAWIIETFTMSLRLNAATIETAARTVVMETQGI